MIHALVLSLAMAGTLEPAGTAAAMPAPIVPVPPPAAPGPAEPAPEGAGVPLALAAEEPHRDDPGGWRHAVGLGAHSTTFFSKEGSQYTFHSASLGYAGSLGKLGGFLHVFALVPLQARQDGNVYATSTYYRQRSGADLLLGAQRRWALRPDLELEAGPGLHGTFIYLPGVAGYRDFSAFPLGLGAAGTLRWRTSAQRLSRSVTVGTYASVSYDFRDPMHANDLAHGYAFRAGVALGLGARR